MRKVQLSILLFLFINVAWGQELKVSIEGNATFDNSQYSINEAGEDFPSSIESESSVYVSVIYGNYWDRKHHQNKKWRIHIHKSDLTWNDNLKVEAKRTGKGHNIKKKGKSKIYDGDHYQNATNLPTYFFGGKDEITNIPVNLKISGISVIMGAKEFETNMVFTVYDD
jgi:hypothetical protein